MSKKSVTVKTPENEDLVRLKPVLGIRPGVYLAIAYFAAALLILYLILLHPGITRPGSMVVFTSFPSGAALRVDDVYAGTSPCAVFVEKGEHLMEAVLPGFDTSREKCTVYGRVFASKIFPLRHTLNFVLRESQPLQALTMAALDYANWSFAGEPVASWQIPLSLSDGVYRTCVSGVAAANSDSIGGIIKAAARFAVTRASLRDLVRANAFAAGTGIPPSPLRFCQAAAEMVKFLEDNHGSASWLADTLPADSASVLIASAWYQNQLASFAEITAREVLGEKPGDNPGSVFPSGQIRVNGLLFNGISGGNLVQSEPFPHEVPVDSFLICAAAVPAPAYADFLDANPQWKQDNRGELIKNNLVNSEYLADYSAIGSAGSRVASGITSVSWFAAQAFCEWLTGKLPVSFRGWEVRLPAEAEWEYAAKTSRKYNSSIFIQENATSYGGIWEWCHEPYAPLSFIKAPSEWIDAVGSPEQTVRGGAWQNVTGIETRASLPPTACSPFISFRPVIVRKQ